MQRKMELFVRLPDDLMKIVPNLIERVVVAYIARQVNRFKTNLVGLDDEEELFRIADISRSTFERTIKALAKRGIIGVERKFFRKYQIEHPEVCRMYQIDIAGNVNLTRKKATEGYFRASLASYLRGSDPDAVVEGCNISHKRLASMWAFCHCLRKLRGIDLSVQTSTHIAGIMDYWARDERYDEWDSNPLRIMHAVFDSDVELGMTTRQIAKGIYEQCMTEAEDYDASPDFQNLDFKDKIFKGVGAFSARTIEKAEPATAHQDVGKSIDGNREDCIGLCHIPSQPDNGAQSNSTVGVHSAFGDPRGTAFDDDDEYDDDDESYMGFEPSETMPYADETEDGLDGDPDTTKERPKQRYSRTDDDAFLNFGNY